MAWFIEEKSATSSSWNGAVYEDRPEVDGNMRLKRVGGTGARVRAQPVEISSMHELRPIKEIQEIYGIQDHKSEVSGEM